ncbi:MAG TPA: hypothetical protein VHY22_10175, partial [Chthoniobacteraceae bacterium]|nr:hypothetical protein [Chthoniobacteraceae bacterium]
MAANSAAPAGQLLSNHDFSVAKKDPAFPDDWHRKPWMTWEAEKNFHFLRLTAAAPGKDISAWRDLGIPPGVRAVRVTIRYRTSGVRLMAAQDAGLHASFVFLDAVKIKFAPPPPPLELSSQAADWRDATAKIAVPPGATTLWMSIGMFQVESGTLDLADVGVTPIPASEAPQPVVAQTMPDSSIPIRRDGAHTIIGYGAPKVWFIRPYVDVVGHDFDMGLANLVRQLHDKGLSAAIGVSESLDDGALEDVKNRTYVFSYKNINFPLPAEAHRLIFLNTWLLPKTEWPASRAGRKDFVLLGSKTLHNNGDGLASSKDRWWQIQKGDPDLTITVLDGAGYFLPISVWRSMLFKVLADDP